MQNSSNSLGGAEASSVVNAQSPQDNQAGQSTFLPNNASDFQSPATSDQLNQPSQVSLKVVATGQPSDATPPAHKLSMAQYMLIDGTVFIAIVGVVYAVMYLRKKKSAPASSGQPVAESPFTDTPGKIEKAAGQPEITANDTPKPAKNKKLSRRERRKNHKS